MTLSDRTLCARDVLNSKKDEILKIIIDPSLIELYIIFLIMSFHLKTEIHSFLTIFIKNFEFFTFLVFRMFLYGDLSKEQNKDRDKQKGDYSSRSMLQRRQRVNPL